MFHMKRFTSKTQKIGELGENICVSYLSKKGFSILDRNYTQKNGEIDIVAKKDNFLHFIEVKSIKNSNNVSYETYNPAQNLTRAKILKIHKTIKDYLLESNVSYETKWSLDLYAVYIDLDNQNHKLSIVENIILEN